ncbi:hypothetical protein KC19_12G099900 [Ceratodon purpureus]|uniref:Uncharacterized protein n=1 Tax=Ceratodon purpureus TaxID=3225 RepID=A0A8T0G888_CERPU|nr:hypothetical protein KC19_12G099900 [Ceratodon purpureus]
MVTRLVATTHFHARNHEYKQTCDPHRMITERSRASFDRSS